MSRRGHGHHGATPASCPAVNPCDHLTAIGSVRPAVRYECDECVPIGATWVHLRTCQECGGTRCCDNSPNRHASRHAKKSGHPVVASAEPGERWLWCYVDDQLVEYGPGEP